MDFLLLVGICCMASTAFWLLWQLVFRPYAVASGMIPLTAYDYLVRAWKAERRFQWGNALDAYDKAIELEPENEEVRVRRAALLAAHPYLIDEDTEPVISDDPARAATRPTDGKSE